MLKLVIADDEGKTTVVPLVREEISIGRKEGNTIRLTERNVSRRHAKLLRVNGSVMVEDLGSYNGVKVNGRKIDGQTTVEAGDQIVIGDYRLALQTEAAQADAQPPAGDEASSDAATALIAAPAAEPRPPARLVMLSPPAPGAEFALSRQVMRFGRAEDLDAWVNHRSISREHAEVRREADEFTIADLGSANGLRVNGRDVSKSAIKPGDMVELGQVRFRFVGAGERYVFQPDAEHELAPRGKGSKAPLLAAGAIVLLAVAVAAVVVVGGGLTGGDADGPLVTVESDGADQLVPTPGSPDLAATVPSPESALAQAIDGCRAALSGGRFDEAIDHATRAVGLGPENADARACKDAAEAGQTEQRTFARGAEALAGGEVDTAYFAFEELPQDSPFRSRTEVDEARERFAQAHIAQARAAVRGNPTDAMRHAEMVLTMPDAPVEHRDAAELIRRRLSGQASAPVAAVRRRPSAGQPRSSAGQARPAASREPGPAAESPAGPPGASDVEAPAASGSANVIQSCFAESNYSRCIVDNLEGRARGCREVAVLIEAYRSLGNMGAAIRQMQGYVRRCGTTREANHYRQILAAHGATP